MYKDKSGLFKDFNFKLVVINSLLDKETSFGEELERLENEYNEENEEFEIDEMNTSILEFLQELTLTQEDLNEVTELVFDGGEDIYFMIYPDWDGEDDIFDVTSVEGIEKLNNLSEVIYVSMASEDVINEIEAMGIEVK